MGDWGLGINGDEDECGGDFAQQHCPRKRGTRMRSCTCTHTCTQVGLEDEEAAFANSSFWGFFTVGRALGVSADAVLLWSWLYLWLLWSAQ